MNDTTAANTSPNKTINSAIGNGLNRNPAPIVKSDPGRKSVHATVYEAINRTAPILLCPSMYLKEFSDGKMVNPPYYSY